MGRYNNVERWTNAVGLTWSGLETNSNKLNTVLLHHTQPLYRWRSSAKNIVSFSFRNLADFVVVVILERKYALKSTFARDVPIKKVYCDKKKDSNKKWTNRKRRKIDKNNLKDVKLPIIAWNCVFFVCVYVIWFAFIAVVCYLHVRGILFVRVYI